MTGMKLTWKHFANKKELAATLQYPHEKWPIPDRDIGFDHSEYNLIRSRLHVDIDDCIACMQCERACPVDCIKIDSIKPSKDNEFDCGITSNDTQKKMIVSRFTIDMSECMYCNLCVYPCPEECIYMVGGPNAAKHEIDYEFSQYKRDGMIFEFADATDDDIRGAGGETWLDKRDAKILQKSEGEKLKGIIPEAGVVPDRKEVAAETPSSKDQSSDSSKKSNQELAITSFNDIADKMCRGISKKAYTVAKRAGKDNPSILASVAQALQDAGKLSEDIQSVLDLLSKSENIAEEKIVSKENGQKESAESNKISDDVLVPLEIDIKDLNDIEDKMARGIAKKAFVAAKRNNENKINAISKALGDADKMNNEIESLLSKYLVSNSDVPVVSDDSGMKDPESPVIDSSDSIKAGVLFLITDLNGIDDKMVRGMAKKIYTAGKRANKTSKEIIGEIKNAINEAGKMDDDIMLILDGLER